MTVGPLARTAQAAEKPCQMYRDHGSAFAVTTQGHHVFPEFLQRRVWGEIRDHELLFLCGTCHDNVHAWLYWLLGQWRRPTLDPPPRAKALAQQAFDRYQKGG